MPEEAAGPAHQNLERKLATILSADVAGYSRLMAADEEGTLRTFSGHKAVFEELVAMHKGRIFNTAGDAILAEFNSAVEAVRCATEIQAALQTRNHQIPPDRQVKFRIGVNLGDVMVHGHDLLGDGVNLAARLQTAAEPGGICISGSVYDQIRNKLSLSFNPLGERNYKNIPQPVRTFSITESEDRCALPSAKPASSSPAKWVAAALGLALVIGGGFWAYRDKEAGKAEPGRAPAQVNQNPTQTNPVERGDTESKPSAAASQTPADPAASKSVTPQAKPSIRRAATTPEPPDTPARAASTAPAKSKAAGPGARSTPDGVYAGPMCFGPMQGTTENCFHTEATLAGGKISGQWEGFRRGVVVYVDGEVSPSGEVHIHLRNENSGVTQGRAEFTGSLRDGKIVASGAFRNGRTTSLTWKKEPGGAQTLGTSR